MYMTFKQFVERHPWPSLSALRCIYFDANKSKNKFLPAFSKIGRRLLIDPTKFFQVVEGYADQDHTERGAVS